MNAPTLWHNGARVTIDKYRTSPTGERLARVRHFSITRDVAMRWVPLSELEVRP